MTIREAKEKKLIPVEFNFIPNNCPTCDNELLINENLTSIECSNLYCSDRVAYRAEQMLKNFGIVGAGISFCKKYFNRFPNEHHTMILLASQAELVAACGTAYGISVHQQILNVLLKTYTFDDIVAKLALPNINQDAYKIFKGIYGWRTFKEAIKEVTGNFENYLITLDGFGKLKAESIAKTLLDFDYDLTIADKLFKKYYGSKKTYSICLTGYTNFYNMTKSEYVDYVKKISDGVISIVQKSSFTWDTDYLIAANKYEDYPEEWLSSKHRKALERERLTQKACILTAQEFVDLIIKEKEEIVNGGDKLLCSKNI